MSARNRSMAIARILRRRPLLELLEDRLTPSVTPDFSGGVLTLTLGAENDQVFLQRFNNKIDVGTTDGGKDIVAGQAGVTSIVVKDGGANAGQAVSLSNHGANYPQEIELQGIEKAYLYRATGKAATGDAQEVRVFAPGTLNGRIGNGVGLAASGGAVYLDAGTYAEKVTISKPLTLIGDPGDDKPGPGSQAPTLDGTTVGAGGRAITILDTSDVAIRGLRLVNWAATADGNGVLIKHSSRVTVKDNLFQNTGGSAVLAAEPSNTDISVLRNQVITTGGYGIQIDYAQGAIDVEQNDYSFTPPAVASTAKAGVLVISRSATSPTVTVKANCFDGNPLANGVYLKAIAGGKLAGARVENNYLYHQLKTAVRAATASGGTLTGLVVYSNAIDSVNTAIANQTSALVNASANTWTKGVGFIAPQGKVQGPVDYSPTVAANVKRGSNVGFYPAFNGLSPVPGSPIAGPRGGIEEAVVDSDPGATVILPQVATFSENFVADRDVSINFRGLSDRFILSPQDGKIGLSGTFQLGLHYAPDGGTLALDPAGPSTLTFHGNLEVAQLERLYVRLQNASHYDRIVVTGTVQLDGEGLADRPPYPQLLPSTSFSAGDLPAGTQFTVLQNGSSSPIHGRVNDSAGEQQPEGSQMGHVFGSLTPPDLEISYKGGDGNDMTLTVV